MNIEFDELDFFLVPTGQATQAGKIQFKLGKNPVHQTQNFKIENVKNQVHILLTLIQHISLINNPGPDRAGSRRVPSGFPDFPSLTAHTEGFVSRSVCTGQFENAHERASKHHKFAEYHLVTRVAT